MVRGESNSGRGVEAATVGNFGGEETSAPGRTRKRAATKIAVAPIAGSATRQFHKAACIRATNFSPNEVGSIVVRRSTKSRWKDPDGWTVGGTRAPDKVSFTLEISPRY